MAQPDPDKIVADIDRQQNEEDLGLPKRVWEKVKSVGSKVIKELSKTDDEAYQEVRDYQKKRLDEKNAADQEAQQKKMRNAIGADEIENAMRNGKPKKMAGGGKVSSASKRADGCAIKGKTRGRIV